MDLLPTQDRDAIVLDSDQRLGSAAVNNSVFFWSFQTLTSSLYESFLQWGYSTLLWWHKYSNHSYLIKKLDMENISVLLNSITEIIINIYVLRSLVSARVPDASIPNVV